MHKDTVRIKVPDTENGIAIINADEFDPTVHVLAEPAAAPAEVVEDAPKGHKGKKGEADAPKPDVPVEG